MRIPRRLVKLLSCNHCKSTYCLNNLERMPNELSCRHILCSGCVKQLRGVQSIICPECYEQTQLPIFGYLPSHDGLLFLLQQLPALNLGRMMLKQQNDQRLQLHSDMCRTPWPEWINEVSVKSGHCVIHKKPSSIWCHTCNRQLCFFCPVVEHQHHDLSESLEPAVNIRRTMENELDLIEEEIRDAEDFATADMTLLSRLCDACESTQQELKAEMQQHAPTLRVCHMRDWLLRTKHALQQHDHSGVELTPSQLIRMLKEVIEQHGKFKKLAFYSSKECWLRAIIHDSGQRLVDFAQLHRRLLSVYHIPEGLPPATGEPTPFLLLANYCIYWYWWNMHSQISNEQNHDGKQLEDKEQKYKLQREKNQKTQAVLRPTFRCSRFNFNSLTTILEEENTDSSSNSSKTGSSRQESKEKYPDIQIIDDDISYHQQFGQLMISEGLLKLQPTNSLDRFDFDLPSTSAAAAAAAAAAANAAQGDATPLLPIYPMSPVQFHYTPSSVPYPVYYLNMEMSGKWVGRILIEVCEDVAPLMAENFRLLISHKRGFGFKGCSVFQAWNNDSIVTGDFELQNGRGGYAALEERFFMPDVSGLPAQRGAVGMRRGLKRYDNNGMVGSQFRMLINATRMYTAIFGFIVEGIELLDKIGSTGDRNGNPKERISINDCGVYRHGA
uniref:CG5071-like protein n=1 Tax=Drosophila buzzatii TaxID=7264 RepID=I3RSD7_DROBU|nr:CG5071-like protein [Drosophila buzzatii]